ncbi:MAG: SHOCT domain-containing protein [Burkholderiales bacterium]|nr:SHOCT domain-containing protein [Burkholderiales bacterium]
MGGMHGLWWLFWIVLIGAGVYSMWGRRAERRRGSRETPHEVLQRRLANGEIDTQEYERRKALLDRDAGKPS